MIKIKRLDHVFITVPLDSMVDAKNYYGEVLQLNEIIGDHPNGAIWFQLGDIELHIGEEGAHQIDSDRHIALEVSDLAIMKDFLKKRGILVTFSTVIPGRDRCFFRDPWGNRFELIAFNK